ncbi:MAG TPA: CPBP family intramembrane metalloprotease, partial [Bacilli bacterium]|nr:CPBP family intramembrane metalloprotease [Bacilli bacterium]
LFLEAAIKSNAAPLVFVAAVIQAPILEELIFRKTLFGMLEKKFRLNKIVTLVIATLFFALIHVVSELTSGDPMQMLVVLTYIPLSLTLGIAYIQTENLLIPMIIHFLNNVLAFLSVVGVINV